MKYTSGDVLVGSRRKVRRACGGSSLDVDLSINAFVYSDSLRDHELAHLPHRGYSSSFTLVTYCLPNLLAWHSASSPAHSNHLFEPQACLRSPPASGANQSDIFGGHRTKSPLYSGLVSSALWGPSHCLDYRLYDDTWAMRTRV